MFTLYKTIVLIIFEGATNGYDPECVFKTCFFSVKPAVVLGNIGKVGQMRYLPKEKVIYFR